MTTTRSRRLILLAAAPMLAAALAACSTGPTEETPPDAGAPSDSPEDAFFAWQIDFAECMRGQGIDMPDPEPGRAAEAVGPGDDMDAYSAASEVCLEELGEPPIPGGDEAIEEQRESNLELAQCFRENGIDVVDPKPGEGFAMPDDVPEDVLEACLPEGVVGTTQ